MDANETPEKFSMIRAMDRKVLFRVWFVNSISLRRFA